jgi:hypothetical protein
MSTVRARDSPPALEPAFEAPEDQRHPHRRVVNEEAVGRFAVVSEPLAVICGHDDERPFAQAQVFDPLDDTTDFVVRRCHLGVVRARGNLGVEFGRGLVGAVGVEIVEPQEERLSAIALDELDAAACDIRTEPDRFRYNLLVRGVGGEREADELNAGAARVPPVLEALGDPGLGAEHGRRDLRARAIAVFREHFCERGVPIRQHVARVRPHAVGERLQACEDRRVGGQRRGAGRHRLLVYHACLGEPVEIRRRGQRLTVRPERIRARGVERDEHDVQWSFVLPVRCFGFSDWRVLDGRFRGPGFVAALAATR